MKADEKNIEIELQRISDLLEETLDLYRKDRKLAKKNYDSMKSQLDEVIDTGAYMSEDGNLERAVNTSLKLVFESGKRLDKALEAITKLLITQFINNTKLQIADKLIGTGGTLTGPIDLKKLIDDGGKF